MSSNHDESEINYYETNLTIEEYKYLATSLDTQTGLSSALRLTTYPQMYQHSKSVYLTSG